MHLYPPRSAYALLVALSLIYSFAHRSALATAPNTGSCECRGRFTQGCWNVYESPNFRFFHVAPEQRILPLVNSCETSRSNLSALWLGAPATDFWSPKCDIFLYDDPQAFTKGSGYPPQTQGIANLEIGDGRVWCRQIHVRFDRAENTNNVLLHELVHVVLADRFTTKRIPRWLDEGIALLSERGERFNEYSQFVQTAHHTNGLISLDNLFATNLPAKSEAQTKLFYGQSASVVAFFIERGSRALLMQFVESVQTKGVDQALHTHYGIESRAELENEWRGFLESNSSSMKVVSKVVDDKVGPGE